MDKLSIKKNLFSRPEFFPKRKSIGSDECVLPSDSEITCRHYVDRLLDILEEVENYGIKVNDENLISYLNVPEGGFGASYESALEDMNRLQELKKTLRGSTIEPVQKIADWAEKGVKWQKREFWFVGILGTVIIGFLAFIFPYLHEIKSSKEPIKVQIIEQAAPEIPSEPITPESANIVVTKSL